MTRRLIARARGIVGVAGVVGVGAVAIVMAIGAPAVLAAPAATVILTPAFQDITIAKDQSQATFQLKVRNDSDDSINYKLSALDFKSLNETGGVAFVGENPSKLEQKYGLAAWLILEKNVVSVPAHGAADVKITIDNRESLSPGGHYGAVLLTRDDSGTVSQGRGQVKLNQVLTSLLLVKKTGGEVYGLRLASRQIDGSWWKLPTNISLRFQNTGNVHVVPRGTVKLIDPFNRVVKQGIINVESGATLPESFRRYVVGLDDLGVFCAPGWYHLLISYRHDDGEIVTRSVPGFFWFGWPWIGLTTAFIAVIIFAASLLRRRFIR